MEVYLQTQKECLFCRKEMPFGNEIQLSMSPGSWTFGTYKVLRVYLQNPFNGCLLFSAPSEGRCPLEMKCNYPSTLGHGILEYIWLWGLSPKTPWAVACFFLHLQERDGLWKWNINYSKYHGSWSFKISFMGSFCCIAELPVNCCSQHVFFITFRRKTSFRNVIYLSKYPKSCSFKIHMVIEVYL